MPENPDVQVVEPEKVETPTVEVDLTPKAEAKPEPPKPQESEQLQLLRNKISSYDRILHAQRQELEALKQKVATPSPAPAPVAATDEYDQLVEQGKWKEAVRGLGKEVATQVYRELQAQSHAEQAIAARQTALERSKAAVLEKYPDLDPASGDPESEVSKAYTQVLNAYPTLLQVENGPEIAMALMESRGVGKPSPVATDPRRVRASQASLPPSRTGANPNVVQITRDEKDYIENNRLPGGVENVTRIKRALEQRGEVSA